MMHRPLRLLAIFSLILTGLTFAGAGRGLGQFRELGLEFQRSNPQFVAAFRDAVTAPSKGTVRILCDGKETALGMVVSPDGWILTKSHDLHGAIVCRLRDGRSADARLVGVHQPNDLAMLQIAVRGLTPIEFKDSRALGVGTWIACPGPGDEPVAVGIVSVATRSLPARLVSNDAGFLGVSVEDADGLVRIIHVVPDSPASGAGLKAQDVIVAMQSKNVSTSEDFLSMMQQRRAGEAITIVVRRDKETLPLQVTLGRRPRNSRGDSQNHMGSELSSRTTGYATILQHDAVLRPRDCGGPLVDLDGKVVGMNVCRAGRTESWAIPAEIIQPLLADLASGKLAPPSPPVRFK